MSSWPSSVKNEAQSQGISPAVRCMPLREGTLWKRGFWGGLGNGVEVAASCVCVCVCTLPYSKIFDVVTGAVSLFFCKSGGKGFLDFSASFCIHYSGWQKAQPARVYTLFAATRLPH